MTYRIEQGDCLQVLKTLPPNSVNCCVTSPPYYGLRDYGTANWEGGRPDCDHESEKVIHREFHQTGATGRGSPTTTIHSSEMPQGNCIKCGAVRKDKQIGLEKTPDEYVQKLVAVFREVKRVLRDDGTLWLNLGDSYAGSGKGDNPNGKQGTNKGTRFDSPTSGIIPDNLKPKDLIGIPWRVAFALQADGWYLRSDIIWAKPNPMPESVKDRPTKSHEYIFLLAKAEKYYYDYRAITELANYDGRKDEQFKGSKKYKDTGQTFAESGHTRWNKNEEGNRIRNKRSVWTVTTKPFREAHFATFPEDLIRPCILAGCPEGGTVLDPFNGAGTTGVVSVKYDRNYIGIELNEQYIEMSNKRIQPLLAQMRLA